MLIKWKAIHNTYTKAKKSKEETAASDEEHVMFFDIKTDKNSSVWDF